VNSLTAGGPPAAPAPDPEEKEGSTAHPVVILVGPPGSGKSTVGLLLAARLGTGFLDTDDEVAAAARKPVEDVFVEDGEAAFRALEHPVAERALGYPGVVALGSGAVLDPRIQRLLAGQPVVYLETGFAEVARRTGLNQPRVPVPGNPRGMLRAMLDERRPLYARLARVVVQTDDLEPDEVAGQIAAWLSRSTATTGTSR
jgi:shikimate kinase